MSQTTPDILRVKPVRETPVPWYTELSEPRLGVMLHWDASASDVGSLTWLLVDPTCRVSYNWIVTDDGGVHDIAPPDCAAWHAGTCKTSDPVRLPYRRSNSAFYGVAAAAYPGDTITPAQHEGIVLTTLACFQRHGWTADELWRITDHKAEAVYGRNHPLAGQRGRKHDIDGVTGMTLESVRRAVGAYLRGRTT